MHVMFVDNLVIRRANGQKGVPIRITAVARERATEHGGGKGPRVVKGCRVEKEKAS